MSNISIRLPEELERRLDQEARASQQRRSDVVREALRDYIARRERERLRIEMGAAARALGMEPEVRAEVLRVAEEFAPSDQDALSVGEQTGEPDKRWWD